MYHEKLRGIELLHLLLLLLLLLSLSFFPSSLLRQNNEEFTLSDLSMSDQFSIF